ncbi:hypothetical protein BDR06DRAFT_983416 [Suillus hirtellus]|nr:hypothetical protein BDR06DRAFT_983416 [Suillus hirtellus]
MMDYIHDGLECLGPNMLHVLAGIKAEPVSNVLPWELSIIVNNVLSDVPTHMFMVFSSHQLAPAHRCCVMLFPAHNLIFAIHCMNLPVLPTPTPAIAECTGQEIKVSVVPLCIPAPEIFPQLSAFLYMKHIDHLLGSLMPLPTLPQLYLDDPTTVMPLLTQFTQKIADTYTRLWCTLDTAWEVLFTSLTISTGKPSLTS